MLWALFSCRQWIETSLMWKGLNKRLFLKEFMLFQFISSQTLPSRRRDTPTNEVTIEIMIRDRQQIHHAIYIRIQSMIKQIPFKLPTFLFNMILSWVNEDFLNEYFKVRVLRFWQTIAWMKRWRFGIDCRWRLMKAANTEWTSNVRRRPSLSLMKGMHRYAKRMTSTYSAIYAKNVLFKKRSLFLYDHYSRMNKN